MLDIQYLSQPKTSVTWHAYPRWCMIQVLRTQREGIPWGFVTSITRDGVTLTDISVSFDEEVVYKYDWVGKAADGFPQLEGNAEEIMGKHFVIRQACMYWSIVHRLTAFLDMHCSHS